MALYQKRIQAHGLRKKGMPIGTIAQMLAVSKSTASMWCRDIILSNAQKEAILKNSLKKTNKGRTLGALMNKQKRLDAIAAADSYGKRIIKKLTPKQLLIIATALYWAEGAKSDFTAGFQFINSDPAMIVCMQKFLLAYGVSHQELFCTIQINQVHKPRINNVLKFWKKLLDLSDEQVGNPSFVKTAGRKVYENHDRYFGICRLKVRKSTALKYTMLGLIKAVKDDILSG